LQTAACSGECPLGFFCPIGSFNSTMLRCPAGRYGMKTGLYNSACSGLCAPGYHCPEASTSPYEFECGVRTSENRTDADVFTQLGSNTGVINPFHSRLDHGEASLTEEVDISGASIASNVDMMRTQLLAPNSVFCPEGTFVPLKVFPGYYTIGQNKTTRFDQMECPAGSYCTDGIIRDCPAGRYGRASRLSDADCTGPCAQGHYCPPGSTSRHEKACPIGRYGATEGLSTSSCSGACKKALDCPIGSVQQQPSLSRQDSSVY